MRRRLHAAILAVVALAVLVNVAPWLTPVRADFALVQFRSAGNSGATRGFDVNDDFSGDGTVTVTGMSGFGASNALIVGIAADIAGRTVSSITGCSATFSELHRNASGPGSTNLWAGNCTAGGGTSVAVTLSSGTTGQDAVYVWEVSGQYATLTEEGTSTGANTTAATTHTASSVTPTNAPNSFYGMVVCNGDGGTWGMDAQFTQSHANTEFASGYRLQTDTTAQDFSVTTTNSRNCNVSLAAIRGAAASASTPRLLTLLGVGR